MARAFYPSSATPGSSQLVLKKSSFGDSVSPHTYEAVPLKLELLPADERVSGCKTDGRISEPSQSAEIDSLLDDVSPWDRKILLTLDGGGVRGLSSLLIMRELMRMIGEEERRLDHKSKSSFYSPLFRFASSIDNTEYLPCHYFDCIGGTSTGALIAIMLGRLRMSVDQTIKAYQDLAENIFRSPSNRLARLWNLSHKRASRRRKLKEKFDLLSDRDGGQQFVSETRGQCQTIVCTLRRMPHYGLAPVLFRSHEKDDGFLSSRVDTDENSIYCEHELRYPNVKDVRISMAAQAATAAPSFARPMKQEFDGNIYYDAVMTFNNPSWVIYKDIVKEQGQELDCLVSIGCGKDKRKQSRSSWQSSFDKIRDSSVLNRDLQHQAEMRGFRYYRLDVEHKADGVRLDEWKPKSTGESTMHKIQGAADVYLEREEINKYCRAIAERLVQRRTQRAKTMKWELFASGTWYICPEKDCPEENSPFEHRNALLDHLRAVHDYPPPDAEHYQEIQHLLDQGRTNIGRHQ